MPEINHDRRIPALEITCDGSDRCNAEVGRQLHKEYNSMNLCEDCDFSFTHEILHTLGVIHEHSRPDTDQFVMKHYGLIPRGQQDQWTHEIDFESNFFIYCSPIVTAIESRVPITFWALS